MSHASTARPSSVRHPVAATARGRGRRRACVLVLLLALLGQLCTVPAATAASGTVGVDADRAEQRVPVPRFVRLDTGRSFIPAQEVHRLERLPDGGVRLWTGRDVQTLASSTGDRAVTPVGTAGDRAASAAADLDWSTTDMSKAWWDAYDDGDGGLVAFVCRDDPRFASTSVTRPVDDCLLRRRVAGSVTWQTLAGGGSERLEPRGTPDAPTAPPARERWSAAELTGALLPYPRSAVLDPARDVLHFTESAPGGNGLLWTFDLRTGELSQAAGLRGLFELRLRPGGGIVARRNSTVVLADPTTGGAIDTDLTSRGSLGVNADDTVWTGWDYDLVRTALEPADDAPPVQVVPSGDVYDALRGVQPGSVLDDPAGVLLVVTPHPSADRPRPSPALYRVETAPRPPSAPAAWATAGDG